MEPTPVSNKNAAFPLLMLLAFTVLNWRCTAQNGSPQAIKGADRNGVPAGEMTTAKPEVYVPLTASAAHPDAAAAHQAPPVLTDGPSSVPAQPAIGEASDENVLPGPSPIEANTISSRPATVLPKDEPVLQGDLSRFKYAFFVKTMREVGNNYWPYVGVIFTADANFCLRDRAPFHVSEFTMYQFLPDDAPGRDGNVVYNTTTYPGVAPLSGDYDDQNLPPNYQAVDFRGSCRLAGRPWGDRSFKEASWSLTPLDAATIDEASTVHVEMTARNSVQSISLALDAKKCPKVDLYFQQFGGHHYFPREIDCERTSGSTTASPESLLHLDGK